MKKLSELSMEEIIYVKDDLGYLSLISVQNYINDKIYLESPLDKIYETNKVIIDFDICSIIDMLGEDNAYEDWNEDMYKEIGNNQIILNGIKELNRISALYPSYWEEQEIENDLLKKQ